MEIVVWLLKASDENMSQWRLAVYINKIAIRLFMSSKSMSALTIIWLYRRTQINQLTQEFMISRQVITKCNQLYSVGNETVTDLIKTV